ncbi:MAG: CGNR zinc finger domain-containing protein [Gemmatimonadota bacterium]
MNEPFPFDFDADQLALDFLNTRGVADARNAETLVSPEAVVAWLGEAGIAEPADTGRLASSPPRARRLFGEALRLRDAVGEAVEAFAAGRSLPVPAVHGINRALAVRREKRRLLSREEGAEVVTEWVRAGPLELLAPVAEAALELLVGADRRRVRRCAADDCASWFLDTSRNGSRRWCSMARCGNRAKVAAFHRRQRTGS